MSYGKQALLCYYCFYWCPLKLYSEKEMAFKRRFYAFVNISFENAPVMHDTTTLPSRHVETLVSTRCD